MVTEMKILEDLTIEVLSPMILTGAITVHHIVEAMTANGPVEMYHIIQTEEVRVG
jgi:hypothetical protein